MKNIRRYIFSIGVGCDAWMERTWPWPIGAYRAAGSELPWRVGAHYPGGAVVPHCAVSGHSRGAAPLSTGGGGRRNRRVEDPAAAHPGHVQSTGAAGEAPVCTTTPHTCKQLAHLGAHQPEWHCALTILSPKPVRSSLHWLSAYSLSFRFILDDLIHASSSI